MNKILALDMDGTFVDLYNVPQWLPKLLAEDTSPYTEALPLVNMTKLETVCQQLRAIGYEIQIITATAKDARPQYKKAIRKAKLEWLQKYGFHFDRFHCIDYKTNKRAVLYRQMRKGGVATAILVDDNAKHRTRWGWGDTINPVVGNLLNQLSDLLGG